MINAYNDMTEFLNIQRFQKLTVATR